MASAAREALDPARARVAPRQSWPVRTYLLERESVIPRPIREVFAFFADPANLQALTPRALHFKIITPAPMVMREGLIIDYQLRLRGIPVRWRSLISEYDPPHRFVDVQVRGPYRKWIHEHLFESVTVDGRDATRVRDRVEYGVPGWLLAPAIHRLLVGPELGRIFDFRREALERRFADS
jgi:ligand-binding SRPBCC domain-containing protein